MSSRAFGVVVQTVMNNPRIGIVPKALYALMATYADRTGRCYPSVQTLASGLGCTPRTVQRALADLVEAKVIRREVRFTGGRQSSNLYVLRDVVVRRMGDAGVTPEDDAGVTQNITRGNKGHAHRGWRCLACAAADTTCHHRPGHHCAQCDAALGLGGSV
jgi:hypothetical protein